MARFLVRSLGKRRRFALVGLIGIILVMLAFQVSSTYATTYTGTFTGYAYGNEYGASGYIMTQGDFANHSNYYCPNDPASYWAFGTYIDMYSPSSIRTYDGNNNYTDRSYFGLNDTGDPYCSMGNYWVDIFYGDYATSSEYNNGCPCSGSPYPGSCSSTQRSNCQDALNFGTHYNYQYDK